MAKKRKKPGPPRTTGPGRLIGVRCQADFLARVDRWRKAQNGEGISKPDAIRRLADMALGKAGF